MISTDLATIALALGDLERALDRLLGASEFFRVDESAPTGFVVTMRRAAAERLFPDLAPTARPPLG